MPHIDDNFFRYLSISPSARRWGLYVTSCGAVSVFAGDQHPQKTHPELYCFSWNKGRVLPEYQVIYLQRGQGIFESATTGRRKISQGDAIILFPNVWHRYRPSPKTGWDSKWLGFDGEYCNRLTRHGFLTPYNPVIPVGSRPDLLQAYERVLQLVRHDATPNPFQLAAGAMEVLAHVATSTRNEPVDPATQPFTKVIDDRLVAEVIRYIWNHMQRTMTVDDVVAQFPVTRRSLERRFKRVLGATIHDEIARCRIERAKRLLEETDLPIKTLASTAGFSTAQRMSKVFQQIVGISPGAYRERLRDSAGQ